MRGWPIICLRISVSLRAGLIACGAAILTATNVPAFGEAAESDTPKLCELDPGPQAGVVKIIDGETVALDNGQTVRLIGALVPRAADSLTPEADWPIERAALDELTKTTLGQTVVVGFSGRKTDRYGKLLGHLFVIDGDDELWVQGHMLQKGMARAYVLPGNTICARELLANEAVAREAKTGLWALPAYAVRAAADVRALAHLRSTFQIVEGRVVDAAEVRNRIYLNFGKNWRRDFTIGAYGGVRRALSAAGPLSALRGARVRARGWIDSRGGPYLALDDLDLLEIIDAGKRGKSTKVGATEPD